MPHELTLSPTKLTLCPCLGQQDSDALVGCGTPSTKSSRGREPWDCGWSWISALHPVVQPFTPPMAGCSGSPWVMCPWHTVLPAQHLRGATHSVFDPQQAAEVKAHPKDPRGVLDVLAASPCCVSCVPTMGLQDPMGWGCVAGGSPALLWSQHLVLGDTVQW